jgi:hypothetical protein
LLVSGQLSASTTYTGTNVTSSSASVRETLADGGTAAWSETTPGTGTGSFSLSFTTVGELVSSSYVGAHGTYTATLLPSAGATGDVTISIAF